MKGQGVVFNREQQKGTVDSENENFYMVALVD